MEVEILAESNLMKAIETKQLKIPENSLIVGDVIPFKNLFNEPISKKISTNGWRKNL